LFHDKVTPLLPCFSNPSLAQRKRHRAA
jgi:hypothetical protein